jgi:hypothetical protein
MREEVTDRYGNVIYLTDERWQHIVERHPELAKCRAEVLSTIRSGDRRQSPYYPDTFHYRKTFRHFKGWFKKIEVVVAFHWQIDKPNNFVVTAYPQP